MNDPNTQSSRSKLQKSKGNKLQRRRSIACSRIVVFPSPSLSLSSLFEPGLPLCGFLSFLQDGQPRPTSKALAQHAPKQACMHETSPKLSLSRARAGRTCACMQRIIAPLPTRKVRHAACGTKAAMKQHLELPLCPHWGFGRQIPP